jgi:hypothetical protein
MILADTPWTFPFWFAWALLSIFAPILFLAALVLAAVGVTRRIGFAILLGGLAGSLCAAIGDLGLMVAVGEHLSQTTLGGWLFAIAGGFSLIGIPAGAFAAARLHQGLTPMRGVKRGKWVSS